MIPLIGVDGARYFIDRKKNTALVTILLGEDPSEHTHPFFGSVVFFSRDKDNVLAATYSVRPF